MKVINSNLEINPKKIVIFGAGKIGRSFIGQLFSSAGYSVVFVDVDQKMVDLLNQKRSYRIVIKGPKESEIFVSNVEAISSLDATKVSEAVACAGILSVSVGKNALIQIAPVIAAGLQIRYKHNSSSPLDIILSENMLNASGFMKEKLLENLPKDYPIDQLVGLVETSIGKMVPFIPLAELDKDPLVVFAEPYNSLIVDRYGFRGEIPNIENLALKENIKAWVDRKAFIHNLGHATVAYFGAFKYPKSIYIYEVLNDTEIYNFAREVMRQSMAVLLASYPNDFTREELEAHIDDLLYRFGNKALGDTIFRVGQDLTRKLGANDRFVGVIRLAKNLELAHDKILEAMTFAFYFKATDENGDRSDQDILFDNHLSTDLESVLHDVCGFDYEADKKLIEEIKNLHRFLNQKILLIRPHNRSRIIRRS